MLRIWFGFLVGWILAGAGTAWAQAVPAVVGERDSVTVRILHTNDLYGQLSGQREDGRLLGEMAVRVHLIRTIRKTGPTLVLNGGDAIGPATLSAWDRGRTVIAAMKRAGYTAMTPGNHEFDYGLETLNLRHKEAGFPFLAANLVGKGGTEIPTTGYLLTDLNGVKVGVVGLVSPDIAVQVNPKHIANVTFADPVEAGQKAVQALQDQGADYLIALVHMREWEAMALVQKLDGVDLVVAGGFRGADRVRETRSLIRMANGVHIVSTPRNGIYLGKVTVQFTKEEDGEYRAVRTEADLIPVEEGVPEDPEAAGMISELEEAYTRATAKVLGGIEGKTLEEQARLVANLIRLHTETEIGIVNQGTFRKVEARDTLYLRDVNHFIRFDDSLVKMVLTGRQLKEIVKKSQGESEPERGLIFSGLDTKKMTVNRRPILDGEPYRVVTVEFLADGGDGYREFRSRSSEVRTGISLRSLVVAWLQAGSLSADVFNKLDGEAVWRSGWSVEGAFRRNYVNGTTEEYRTRKETVSFLSGETSIAWNSASRYFVGYEKGPHMVLFENTADFGQLGRSFTNLETSTDRLDMDLTYRRRIEGLKVDPFVSSGISTAFRKINGARPFLWRSSLGFQRNLTPNLITQFAGRVQRNYTTNEDDYGAEVTVKYQRQLPQGGRFRSDVKSFFGFTDREVISVENYNTFSFPLVGELSLTVRQNNFLYRVSKIQDQPVEGVAFRMDMTVGFAYGLDWKWF